MVISDPDYRPGRDYLSNGEIDATGKLIGGAVANICRELLERRKADRWIPVSEGMPENSQDVLYLARLDDEAMRVDHRWHRWDVVSGWYLNSFRRSYTHWRPFPAPPEVSNG